MATMRGERFEIDLDDDAPHEQAPNEKKASAIPGFIGDVLERNVKTTVIPPSFKSQKSGFPEHKTRTGPSKFKQARNGVDSNSNSWPRTAKQSADLPGISLPSDSNDNGPFDRHQIDAENQKAIANMSTEEIEQERQELFAGLSPALIEKLLKRSNIDDEAFSMEMQGNTSIIDAMPPGKGVRRPSSSERRVSFALPEEQIANPEPMRTASRHSITSSPSPMLAAKFGMSSDVSEIALSRTSSDTSIGSRRSSSSHSHERKVSFVLPDYVEQARKASPTAARHSIASSPVTSATNGVDPLDASQISHLALTKSTSSSSKSPKQRPASTERKVSFAIPEPEPTTPSQKSSAARHSLSSSPRTIVTSKEEPKSEEVENLDLSLTSHQHLQVPQGGTIHFPQAPAAPELDPNSPSFLEDLHEKYFPNLAHDPSKLAWMAPATDEENAAYDPARANLDPKDVRFDFKGQIIPPSKSQQIPTDIGLHHHGDAPSAAGYTIAELGLLARSAFAPQRSIAIQTLGRILFRLGSGEFGNENNFSVEGRDGERALLSKGLWDAVMGSRVIDTITEEANRERGHQTSIALAQEAVWNWRKGGGRQRKAI